MRIIINFFSKAKLELQLFQQYFKKLESKVLHGQYIASVDRQLNGGEDTLLWLWRGEMKGETGSEIMAPKDERQCKPNMRQKYYKQKEKASVEYKHLMIQWNTSYQHAQ
jgi:hypothetical protein